jgi:adenosylcobinamide kinase/adenosylcobinamide-phosphate guanylyltransferase
MFPGLIFILGGAASGKSEFAEGLAESSGLAKHYLATSEVSDREMSEKIERHRARRGADWTTHEAPLDVEPVLAGLNHDCVCLFDCATLWLGNQMMADRDLEDRQTLLIAALTACRAPVIVVSNELGQGIVPADPMTRRFREAQGRLNIALAREADLAVQVVAGLPLVLKGQLP